MQKQGFAIAIQDQVISTKNYLKHVIKDNNVVDNKCRRCKNQQETIVPLHVQYRRKLRESTTIIIIIIIIIIIMCGNINKQMQTDHIV
jgi:hypothetical protein